MLETWGPKDVFEKAYFNFDNPQSKVTNDDLEKFIFKYIFIVKENEKFLELHCINGYAIKEYMQMKGMLEKDCKELLSINAKRKLFEHL